MKVLITGGGGFIGYRLALALLKRGTLADAQGKQAAISQITLLDIAFPAQVDPRLTCVTGDLTDKALLAKLMGSDTGSVFHLASIVSGGAEADFDLGLRINLDGTRALLETCRAQARPPRYVFASTCAAFGGDLPEVVDDSTTPNPQSSYGAQKVCCEYLTTDYNRKGFIDGRSIRLPTISVRAGKPNLAASSFASGIIREPLAGVVSPCPVDPETCVWILSPSKVVDDFIHAHDLPSSAWGVNRVLNLPGITTSVKEMVDALRKIAGDQVADLVEWKPDARVQAIVKTWPARFSTARAVKLGFVADQNIEGIIGDYISEQGIKV
ncbi:MAG: NAD-dependent epimerase [Proteobacteria bacterium]|nr:NAD-dependent epimerase [Pseudomonadota bacterium]